jgi:hypothetical protein
MSVGVITRTSDAPHIVRFRPFSRVMRSIEDALGGANPTRLRPGADCAVQGRKAQKRPTRLTGGLSPPGCRSDTGDGCDKPNPVGNHHDHRKTYVSAPCGVPAIINFPRVQPIARHYVSTPEPLYAPRPKRFAKNSLRQHVTSLSLAIVEANKLDEFIDCQSLKWIRAGEVAARTLADELGRLADRLER